MPNQVELSVKTDLDKVIPILQRIRDEAADIPNSLKSATKGVNDEVEKQGQAVENYLGRVLKYGEKLAHTLKDDFKTLFNIGSFAGGLKIANQFKGTVSEAFELSDTIRKLSPVFKIAQNDFESFQASMVKGLGEMGLSSDVAVKALEGLVDTPVRAKNSLIEYSKSAGAVAGLAGEQGHEREVAHGMANVLVARGVNPENTGEIKKLAEDLRRVFNQTGVGPTKTLDTMERIFSHMAVDFRKTMTTRGIANIVAATQATGGTGKFFEELLSKGKLERLPLEAQGLKGVVGKNGIDWDKFEKVSKQILSRINFDPKAAAQTLGISDEAANDFVRLSQKVDEGRKSTDGINKAMGNVTDQFTETRGAAESFRASLSRVKAMLATPLAAATTGITHGLNEAAKTDTGAALVTGGSAVLAALLTGGGFRGLTKDIVGESAKEKVYEQVTGETVQKVWVVNASDIGGGGTSNIPGEGAAGGAAGGLLSKAGKVAKGVLGVGTAAVAGYELGEQVISPAISKYTQGTDSRGEKGDIGDRAISEIGYALETLNRTLSGKSPIPAAGPLSTHPAAHLPQKIKIDIDMKHPAFKATVKPSRGTSN